MTKWVAQFAGKEIDFVEAAFKAGHEAGIKSAIREGFAGMSLAVEAQMSDEAWFEYAESGDAA